MHGIYFMENTMLFTKSISSIDQIFRKDKIGNYVKRNAKLSQDILSYALVIQQEKSNYNKPFYVWDLAQWLMDKHLEFRERYQYNPVSNTPSKSRVQYVMDRIRGLLYDLSSLQLLESAGAAHQRRGTGFVEIYKYTSAGYLIALLIESMDLAKKESVANEIYDLLNSDYRASSSSYSYGIFLIAVFKKYKEKGVFTEFLVNVLRNRLDSATTVGDLLARLDVLYFDETEKAKMFIDIWFQTLNELEPNVKELLLHDIKLSLQTTMSKRIVVHHKAYEDRVFELRGRYDRLVLEGKCQNCQSYILMADDIAHYLRRSNLAPNVPLSGVRCIRCDKDNSIIIPLL
jgi:hypothetical protein